MSIWSAEIKEIENLYRSLSGHLPELEKELGQLVKADDENVILLYARRSLGVMVTDLCEKELKRSRGTEPLKGIIDKLNKEEKVPSNIITSMQHLNSLSAYGTHPKEFDPEQVKPALNSLATIIKWYLKYKSPDGISTSGEIPLKEAGISSTGDPGKPKKKQVFLISGLVLVCVIIIVSIVLLGDFSGRNKSLGISEPEKSIAVLPFANLSGDEQQVWFSDGITDVIISHLSKISDLRVLSRTSTLKYKEESKLIPEIGKELGVNYILEGTVQREGNQIRIVIQLLRTRNEDHLWSEIYNREYRDLFAIQSEIARAVANELEAIITPLEKQLIDKVPTTNMTAFDYHLQSRDQYYKYVFSQDKRHLDTIVQLAVKSLELDPEFALAYYWLGNCMVGEEYVSTYYKHFYRDSALVYFNRALELDSNLVEAYLGRGTYYYEKAHKEKAIDDLKKAINLDPNFATAHTRIGMIYYDSRDYENALIHYYKAKELEKGETGTGIDIYIWWIYVSIGDLQRAEVFSQEDLPPELAYSFIWWLLEIQARWNDLLALADTGIALQPEDWRAYYLRSEALVGLNRVTEAEVSIRLALKYSTAEIMNSNHRIGYILWVSGKKEEAMEYLNKQITYCTESIKQQNQYGTTHAAYDLASVYAFLGNREEALKWLRFYEELGFSIGLHEYIKIDPMFDNLRNEEEFTEIVNRVNEKKAEIRARISQMEEQDLL